MKRHGEMGMVRRSIVTPPKIAHMAMAIKMYRDV
jgi:hypothetical protein